MVRKLLESYKRDGVLELVDDWSDGLPSSVVHYKGQDLSIHRELYVDQCNLVNKCIFDAKMGYYSALIEDNHSDPKCLFSNFHKVLHRKVERKLPHSDDDESLANAFADFY